MAVVVPVATAGAILVAAALAALVSEPPGTGALVGALALLIAATVAEANPVPVEGFSGSGVSLAASFLVGAALLFDWRLAVMAGALTRVGIELVQRRPLDRVVFNSATYALASGAAAGAIAVAGGATMGSGAAVMVLSAVVGAFAFWIVNVCLVSLVVARASGAPLAELLLQAVRWTSIPFAIMGSISLMLEVLWERSPLMLGALVGPLVAIALYQRSVHGALEAMRLAKTDPLTGLGNHRAFKERLAELTCGTLQPPPVFTLLMLDVDGFKQINDRHGHQAGDTILAGLAAHVGRDGEAFRLGGDELAVVVHRPAEQATRAAEDLRRRIADEESIAGTVTVSIGIASFPGDGDDVDRLVGAADAALYRAKHRGRNRVEAYADPHTEAAVLPFPVPLQERAIWQLAEIVDAADAGDNHELRSGHARRVGDLAVRVALRLGVEADQIEAVRLAARLHDVGKLVVPIDVLTKREPLVDDEWSTLEQHPVTGQRILEALGATTAATWVRHHHERWDGTGYPDRLAGVHIPLVSRIVFVADAFDAMTTDRPYRPGISVTEAIEELRSCAGTQFDPHVVKALVAELAEAPSEAAVA